MENRNSTIQAKVGDIIELPSSLVTTRAINGEFNQRRLIVVGTVDKEDVLILSTGHTVYEGTGFTLNEIQAHNLSLGPQNEKR